mmetsp:Transcript_13532/g.20611  ORF Transcript_13532/g.20611 Transcript_13532/m.20611 type:complete len:461 (+) Transcript_13532:92-1474(+)
MMMIRSPSIRLVLSSLMMPLHVLVIVFQRMSQIHNTASAFPEVPLARKSLSMRRLRRGASSIVYGTPESMELPNVERIFAVSDLHTDDSMNFKWLEEKCQNADTSCSPGPDDALIVAGDISHDLDQIEATLRVLKEGLQCEVFFVIGNHEAWVGGEAMTELGLTDSLPKIDAINELCHSLGVITEHRLVGSDNKFPTWILPMQSWYDGTLSFPECSDLCEDFITWPWVDFTRCSWPDEFARDPTDFDNPRIPDGLVEYFLEKNEGAIQEIQKSYSSLQQSEEKLPGLITFTHFLPNKQTLPDWKTPESDSFSRSWFDHGAAGVSAKFAKVSGSKLIDEQIRSIWPDLNGNDDSEPIRHIHVFGHSHRPKEFIWGGIRYVHNPLGKPRERDCRMIDDDVSFKLIWDTNVGTVSAEQVIRYWEEKGGGKKVVWRYMLRRKSTRRKIIKSIRQETRRVRFLKE